MATHSSVLAWRIPGMGESGGLPSMGSHRVRHTLMAESEEELKSLLMKVKEESEKVGLKLIQYFCLENPMDGGAW